jgi:hypothetical protein
VCCCCYLGGDGCRFPQGCTSDSTSASPQCSGDPNERCTYRKSNASASDYYSDTPDNGGKDATAYSTNACANRSISPFGSRDWGFCLYSLIPSVSSLFLNLVKNK